MPLWPKIVLKHFILGQNRTYDDDYLLAGKLWLSLPFVTTWWPLDDHHLYNFPCYQSISSSYIVTYSTVSRSLWSAVQFASKFFHHCDHCQDHHCNPLPPHRWSLIRKMQASGGRASLFYSGKGRQTNATLCQPTRIARMLLMMVTDGDEQWDCLILIVNNLMRDFSWFC